MLRCHEGRLRTALVAAMLAGGLAGPPAADARGRSRPDAPNAEAGELDTLGKEAYRKGRWDDAIAAFEAAYQADPLPRFLYNLGRCHEKGGDLARAAHYFGRYLREAPEADDRGKVEALVKMLRVKLKKEFGEVRVTTRPPGALVKVIGEGQELEGITPFSEWVPFGEYSLSVKLEGHPRHEQALVVKPRTPIDVRLRLGDDGEEDGDDPWGEEETGGEQPPASPASGAGGGGSSWPALAGLGVGGALLAGGAVMALLAWQDATSRDELVEESLTADVRLSQVHEQDDAARSKALVANVLLGTGALAVGIGALLLATADDDPAATAVGLAPARGGWALVVGGTL